MTPVLMILWEDWAVVDGMYRNRPST